MYAQRHAAVSIIQLRLTVNDLEFTAVSTGKSNQGTVEIREVHVGRIASLPLCGLLQFYGTDSGVEHAACIAGH